MGKSLVHAVILFLAIAQFSFFSSAVDVRVEPVAKASHDPVYYALHELKTEEVTTLVKENIQFADPKKTTFSCIDGRGTSPIIGTPGGDMAEFMLAVNEYNNRLPTDGKLTAEQATRMLNDFIQYNCSASRPFYMHSDAIGVLKVYQTISTANGGNGSACTAAFNAPGCLGDFSITSPPNNSTFREQLMTVLLSPSTMGCGHIKLMQENADSYGINATLNNVLLRGYFNALWADSEGKVVYVPVPGYHIEGAVTNVKAVTYSEDIVPLVQPNHGERETLVWNFDKQQFVWHQEITERWFRPALARFLIQRYGNPAGNTDNEYDMAASATQVFMEKQLPFSMDRLRITANSGTVVRRPIFLAVVDVASSVTSTVETSNSANTQSMSSDTNDNDDDAKLALGLSIGLGAGALLLSVVALTMGSVLLCCLKPRKHYAADNMPITVKTVPI